jgi:hypothetical protein
MNLSAGMLFVFPFVSESVRYKWKRPLMILVIGAAGLKCKRSPPAPNLMNLLAYHGIVEEGIAEKAIGEEKMKLSKKAFYI